MRRQGTTHGGFATREVAVTLLVLLAVAGVLVVRLVRQSAEVTVSACHRNVCVINMTIEKWRFDKGRWPADDLSDIARDRAYFPNGIPRCPTTGRPYRMDPATHRVSCSCSEAGHARTRPGRPGVDASTPSSRADTTRTP